MTSSYVTPTSYTNKTNPWSSTKVSDWTTPSQGYGNSSWATKNTAPWSYDTGYDAYGYTPSYGNQSSYTPSNHFTTLNQISSYQSWLDQQQKALGLDFSSGTGTPPAGVGTVANDPGFGQFYTTGDAANVDSYIQAAANQYGVPANFLKSIIARESSGDFDSNAYVANVRPDSGGLLPYIGVFQDAADTRGMGSLFAQAAADPQHTQAIQIQILAGVLRSEYDQVQQQNSQYGWLNVASMHYSGNPDPGDWQDESNNGTSAAYVNQIQTWWQGLDAKAGNTWSNYTGPSGGGIGGSIATIFGGTTPGISEGIETNDWTRAHPDMYSYGNQYGLMNGEHTGIDYTEPEGTKVYSPISGTVTLNGNTGYYEYEGATPGAESGELEITLDNGDVLILGHLQNINGYKIGDKITPGEFVGISGTAGSGPHVHVEYRIPGQDTPSTYRIVDPRQYLNGSYTTGTDPVQQPGNSAGMQAMSFTDLLKASAQGKDLGTSVTLTKSTDAWSNYIQQVMGLVGGGIGSSVPVTDNSGRGPLTGNAADLVTFAKQYVGKPYVWATHGPDTFDCSGLTSYLYGLIGYTDTSGQPLSTGSHQQMYAGREVTDGFYQPGDLLFYNTTGEYADGNYASHVGMYIGNGQMIEAANPDLGVRITSITDPYYVNSFIEARRLI